jgi:hypothetical protein
MNLATLLAGRYDNPSRLYLPERNCEFGGGGGWLLAASTALNRKLALSWRADPKRSPAQLSEGTVGQVVWFVL